MRFRRRKREVNNFKSSHHSLIFGNIVKQEVGFLLLNPIESTPKCSQVGILDGFHFCIRYSYFVPSVV